MNRSRRFARYPATSMNGSPDGSSGCSPRSPKARFEGADVAWEALEDVVLDLLGPRWRREARLVHGGAERDVEPLTPASFEPQPERRSKPAWRRPAVVGVVLAALVGAGVGGAVAASSGSGAHRAQPTVNSELVSILRSLDARSVAGDSTAPRGHGGRAAGECVHECGGRIRTGGPARLEVATERRFGVNRHRPVRNRQRLRHAGYRGPSGQPDRIHPRSRTDPRR